MQGFGQKRVRSFSLCREREPRAEIAMLIFLRTLAACVIPFAGRQMRASGSLAQAADFADPYHYASKSRSFRRPNTLSASK